MCFVQKRIPLPLLELLLLVFDINLLNLKKSIDPKYSLIQLIFTSSFLSLNSLVEVNAVLRQLVYVMIVKFHPVILN